MKKKLPKIALIWLYVDSDKPRVYLDEGQNFKKIIAAFNKQDKAMCDEDDQEGKAHQKWLGFEDFMKSKGCIELDFSSYAAY